jgi:prefoldin subunit 5
MASTIAADRLEYVLVELRDAIDDIEGRQEQLREAPDALRETLLEALRKARRILEEAQDVAEENGVPRLSVFGR